MKGPCVRLEILYEDNHLLVINKPPELATMGSAPGQPSLVAYAKDYLKRKYQKPGNVYLGVVSRLDSFTTGVIVLARTSKAASRLSEQFRQRTVDKCYWALVPDCLPSPSGTLEHWMVHDDQRHRMVALNMDRRDEEKDGQYALLDYVTLGRHTDRALIEVKLRTGRKHQIRAQFAKIRCPIMGDKKYGSPQAFRKGIGLHSQSLKIAHPTRGSEMEFSTLPPNYWNLSGFGIK